MATWGHLQSALRGDRNLAVTLGMVVGGASLVAQTVKNLQRCRRLRFGPGEDLLAKGMEVGAWIMEHAFISQDSRMSKEAHRLTEHTEAPDPHDFIKQFLVTAKPLTPEK